MTNDRYEYSGEIYPGDKIYPDVTGSVRLISKSRDYCNGDGKRAELHLGGNVDELLHAHFVMENDECVAEFPEVPPGNHMVFLPRTIGVLFEGESSFPVTVKKGLITKVLLK